ncbi:MAG: sugar phosphate isomerase/epimerase [Bacteroidetes bacterium]|nr:sugar phosphate isomerase/epimerase [Bacteroidota bacterium]
MKKISRRIFIQNSSLAMAGVMAANQSFSFKKNEAHLSFSTLGCPKWAFPDIVVFASKHGYSGLELRGIAGELDLNKCNEFNSAENISATLKMMDDHKLQFVDLGSSCELHHTDPEKRKTNLDGGKKFIDLAQKINCPYIRVFPNKIPDGAERDATINLIIQGLIELGEYAKGSKVTVLMESHGDAVHVNDLLHIMQNAAGPNTGMIWDVVNMWTITKEPPAMVYDQLKKYIKHTHIKDAKLVDGVPHYVLLGTGDTPIGDAVKILRKEGYTGYYSFEWEKLWHPEIPEPEVALADFPTAIKKYL